jgi:alpha-glucuronidase
MVGVSNVGDDRNWCGHPFAQSNWYAFGRLCWNPGLDPSVIAEEWLKLTFSAASEFVATAKRMMLASPGVCVDTMAPLGLHHLMAKSHHHGPGPWVDEGRPDWTAVYYHRADDEGLGFDRSATGSNAVSQYCSPLRERLGDPESCPEELLLWFHHVSWGRRLPSGRTLWDELCFRYQRGVEGARQLLLDWEDVEGYVDPHRFEHVRALLTIQVREAEWWRDASLAYFRTFARAPMPAGVPEPAHDLSHYQAIQSFPVPGAPWLW